MAGVKTGKPSPLLPSLHQYSETQESLDVKVYTTIMDKYLLIDHVSMSLAGPL